MQFLTVLSTLYLNTLAGVTSNVKIANGRPTTIKKFPHQVAVRFDGIFLCGGSIIHKNIVVTAAHCVQNEIITSSNLNKVSIRAGSTYSLTQKRVGQIVNISDIKVHEKYNDKTIDNDIALLILKQSLMFNKYVAPIVLAKEEPNENEYATAIGWGATNYVTVSNVLRVIPLFIVKRETCNNYHTLEITHQMICAGLNAITDTCPGDSGGPLIINNKLVGITSWGATCDKVDYSPGVYTNVARFYDWITKKMEKLNFKFVN